MTMLERAAELVEQDAEQYCRMSDQIWEYAESRFQEHQSSQLQQDFLQARGFSVRANLAGEETAFIAEYGSGRPVIALLGEFDALSGLSQRADVPQQESGGQLCGHGCGHNLLGTASVAAAVVLKTLAQENGYTGTIRYYGCPAEENAGGKAYLVRDGFFKDCDLALSWHPSTMNMVQSSGCLANFRVFFTFHGIASHAAGSPQLGRSALDAVELMDVGVNYMREHMSSEARIHYAITDTGGTAPNVVQARAQVLYAIRAPRVSEVKELYGRVCDIAKGAALMTGTTVEIKQVAAYSNYISNPVIATALGQALQAYLPLDYTKQELAYAEMFRQAILPNERIAQKKMLTICMGKKEAAKSEQQPILNFLVPTPDCNIQNTSTDVGDVSWVVPTGQIYCACWASGTAGHSWQATAQGKSPLAHKGMLLAARTMAAAACEFLQKPELVEQAHAAWLEELDGEEYPNPLPADARPEIW